MGEIELARLSESEKEVSYMAWTGAERVFLPLALIYPSFVGSLTESSHLDSRPSIPPDPWTNSSSSAKSVGRLPRSESLILPRCRLAHKRTTRERSRRNNNEARSMIMGKSTARVSSLPRWTPGSEGDLALLAGIAGGASGIKLA